MRQAEELIARARRRERERAGVRMKVRLPRELAERARACAAEVGDGLGEWIAGSCRWGGTRVADWIETGLATRKGSEAISLRVPEGMTASEVRRCVEVCCAWCEARRVRYEPQKTERFLVGKW